MRMMGATDLLFITVSQNVSFMGKVWWMLMLFLRLLVLLLAGFTLYADEQDRFICNTIQPGCSNVCFDVFSPVSVFRLWLFHLILLCLPHVLFATYVAHKVMTVYYPSVGGFFFFDRSRGGSTFENSSSSRELSLHKAPIHELPREWGVPRFYCAYLLVVVLRILLEVFFSAGQFFLFGLSMPKSFLCYEVPCTSGVECYISKPMEKTLMLNFMLGVSSLSALLSFFDLVSSVKAMVRWRRRREMLLEEMSKAGEQSSVFTATTNEDSDVLLTRGISLSGSSKSAMKDEKNAKIDGETFINPAESTQDHMPENKDISLSPTPVPTHFVLHSHLRPPMSPRPDRIPPPNPRAPTPVRVKQLGQFTPAAANSGQQSDSSDSQDKRAWV